MISVQVKIAAALLLSLGVAGCMPTTTATKTEEAQPAALAGPALPAVDDPTLYASRSDTKFSVPALPIEKIPAQFRRQEIAYETTEVPGTIIISPAQRLLYLVTGKNTAIRYGIAVGRDGFGWSGVSDVTNKRNWPTWTPPKEMIERDPKLAQWEKGQPGGPSNPLGARAIYLTTNGVDYGYRIHGTPQWKSIGRNASSGCFRMINQDVMDLYERVPMGAKVVVLNRDGSYPTKLTIPPAPKPKKVTPKPAETVVPVAGEVNPDAATAGAMSGTTAGTIAGTTAGTTAGAGTTPETGAGNHSATGTHTTTPSTTAPSTTTPPVADAPLATPSPTSPETVLPKLTTPPATSTTSATNTTSEPVTTEPATN
jgi:lipoprotein-anchoring transpeptidase ErfK/SrfK